MLAIVVTIRFRQGLRGWAQQRWGPSLFPIQRRLVVNAAEAAED
jgi:branched-chain amino acid transport system permease protein